MNFLVAVLIVAGGLVVVFGELGASRKLEKARSWPETKGEVLSFSLTRSYLGDFFASIRYRYRVEGTDYTGDTIRPGGRMTFRSKRLARELEGRYKTGVTVPVYYDPENPAECCIDREQTAAGNSAMYWGLAVIVLGGVVLFRALAN
ncbi:MAG TPA: DUF3592 domain-containing protein [Gammaproteobacteria bacterium]|nr:DUF3592 domain-containing protein [Gammaproteobacteria bacterium]